MQHQVERQCGYRLAGAIYCITETSPNGYPLEYFIRDEPKVVSLDDLSMTPNGVAIREIRTNCAMCNPFSRDTGAPGCPYCADGTGWTIMPHVLDVVGKDNYPNVRDFIEETKRLGASRRTELSADDYRRLRIGSRIMLIHEKAYVENAHEYFARLREAQAEFDGAQSDETTQGVIFDGWNCPKAIADHQTRTHGDAISPDSPKCARVWQYDLDGKGTEHIEDRGPFELVKRDLACGAGYRAYTRPVDLEPAYKHAIFLSLPIHRLELVDPVNEHQDQWEKLRGCELPVTIVDF